MVETPRNNVEWRVNDRGFLKSINLILKDLRMRVDGEGGGGGDQLLDKDKTPRALDKTFREIDRAFKEVS
jgi:hypothetical protein